MIDPRALPPMIPTPVAVELVGSAAELERLRKAGRESVAIGVMLGVFYSRLSHVFRMKVWQAISLKR